MLPWLFIVASLTLALASPSAKRATVCNGHAELCDRSFGNVTFFGSHDSFAFTTDPIVLARDQEVDIPTQLGLGVRLLQAQAHMRNGALHFCHTSTYPSHCRILFDGGTVENYLKKVKTFLDANPNEVLTLIFTNPEGVSIPNIWKPAFDNAGITPLAFVPPSIPMKASDWPTLGQLIDSGKRVVVFLDAGADGQGSGNFILPEFPMIWETPFSQTDASFPCRVDRIQGPLSTQDHMYMINHSLNVNILPIGDGVLVSDPVDAPVTNGVTSIVNHANGCAQFAAGRAPNFVLLDYVNIGQGKQAVDILNGVA
ncbi:hypothetical protein PC9H_002687 [Pleurotus ostreatus]|uniref:PLC-like phosphodiesterase n=1 Tax=Pleurotus ostreatus TaxID=5322 RepID=A0A8H6ZKD0_PLEOS|nr:uncharacterized protein PC9H_002687 [Pleurotus ostreatus]KAF7416421.1 hypothetical protein PC9H_002687 [Pleurotus ostreatus]